MTDLERICGTSGPPPERCKCGHYERDHKLFADEDGVSFGDCTLCDCISFWPPSHNYDLGKENA